MFFQERRDQSDVEPILPWQQEGEGEYFSSLAQRQTGLPLVG
jgi:hypothetical protein